LPDIEGAAFRQDYDQWRICFIWAKEGPTDVEIVDYH